MVTTPPPVEKNNPLVCDTCSEKHFDSFSDYQIYSQMTITWRSNPYRSTINQEFEYKITPDAVVDDKYFYKIHRKGQYNYDIGAHEKDYAPSEGLYRYDYKNQMAFHYTDVNDPSPQLLMNFDREVGDVITLDPEHEILFTVEEKDTFLLDGYPMPRLKGKITSPEDSNLNEVLETTVLTPFYPNPAYTDYPMSYYFVHDWKPENFSDWGTFAMELVFVSDFEYKLLSEDDELISHSDIRIRKW